MLYATSEVRLIVNERSYKRESEGGQSWINALLLFYYYFEFFVEKILSDDDLDCKHLMQLAQHVGLRIETGMLVKVVGVLFNSFTDTVFILFYKASMPFFLDPLSIYHFDWFRTKMGKTYMWSKINQQKVVSLYNL